MLSDSSVLERLLKPLEGSSPKDFAAQLVGLEFPPQDHERYLELSEKAQLDQLSDAEKIELDDLLTANDVLTILQTKARSSLEHATAG